MSKSLDLAKLFSGNKSKSLELVLAKRCPRTGKRTRMATDGLRDMPAGLALAHFAQRNQVRFYRDEELAILTGEASA